MKTTGRTISLTIAVLLPCVTGQAAEPPDRRAIYQATKFGISVNYDLQIRRQAYDAPALAWMQLPPDAQAETRTHTRGAPWIHITLQHRVLGSLTATDVLLEPAQARALQRIVRRQRADYVSYKVTQLGDAGVRRLRLRDSGARADIDWRRAKSSVLPYPKEFETGHRVSDATGIFVLLGRDALQQPGQRLQLPVYSNDHLLGVELSAENFTSVMSKVIEMSGDGEREIFEKREALRVRIHVTPIDAITREEDMVLLGMQGGLTMLVDREWRTPLQISGRLPDIGDLDLRLTRIELLDPEADKQPAR